MGARIAKSTSMPGRLSVVVHADAERLASAVAAFVAKEARRSIEAHGRFAVALAGGTTPKRAYELLSLPPLVTLVPWEGVHLFWTDERCVGSDDPRSNERMAREAFLDRVPIPPDQVHPMRCGAGGGQDGVEGGLTAEQAARRSADEYESLLRRLFAEADGVGAFGLPYAEGPAGAALDLVVLGLGADGHTASLFPGSQALTDGGRWAAPVFVRTAAADRAAGADAAGAGAAGEDLWRVTLTAPFINMAASVLFVVSGPAKAPIVTEVLEGPIDAGRLPAQLIRPRTGMVRWYLDEASAALLQREGEGATNP